MRVYALQVHTTRHLGVPGEDELDRGAVRAQPARLLCSEAIVIVVVVNEAFLFLGCHRTRFRSRSCLLTSVRIISGPCVGVSECASDG